MAGLRFHAAGHLQYGYALQDLSFTLKKLETNQLVHREEYHQMPPKVEYSLTERAKSLNPILGGTCEWGD